MDSGGTKTCRRNGVGVTAPVLSDGVSAFTPGISLHTGGASKFLHGDRVGTFGHETDANQNTTAAKHDGVDNRSTCSETVGPATTAYDATQRLVTSVEGTVGTTTYTWDPND